jgi:hypothetical protein
MIQRFIQSGSLLIEHPEGNIVMYSDHVKECSEIRQYAVKKIQKLNDIMIEMVKE